VSASSKITPQPHIAVQAIDFDGNTAKGQSAVIAPLAAADYALRPKFKGATENAIAMLPKVDASTKRPE
jgi:hypothetical protein